MVQSKEQRTKEPTKRIEKKKSVNFAAKSPEKDLNKEKKKRKKKKRFNVRSKEPIKRKRK